MPITAEYDQEADALYVRLSAGPRSRAIEIDDMTFVDLADDGSAVGLEFLYPSTGLNLQETVRRFALEPQAPAIVAAIGTSGAPVAPPTLTGGAYLASSSMVMVAIEGTVPADRGLPLHEAVAEAERRVQTVTC